MDQRFEFFELKTPLDLFHKLEDDLKLLDSSGQDTKTAFNFFVTAEHLPEWLGKSEIKKNHCILRIVSHIANGAKHFSISVQRHNSVTDTEKFRVFEEGVFEPDVFYEPLLIKLSQKESQELNTNEIDALVLAKKVIEFWRPYVYQY